MSTNKKIIIKTILTILLIEVSIVASLGAFFYYNYETYATAKSGVSKKISLPSKKINFEKVNIKVEEEKSNKNNDFYEGKLGEVKQVFTRKKVKGRLSEIKIQTFNLKEDEIKKAILINILKENNLLDKYTYSYLTVQKINKLEIELNKFLNFHILLGNIEKEKIKQYKEDWLKSYKAFIIKSTILIKQDRYELLSKHLQDLENKYLDTSSLAEQYIPKDSILLSDNLKYVLDKLLNDEYYNDNITEASKTLGIEKNLLLTSIGVEQVRHMTTTRGYAKNLIKQNKYLTNFSKFSYGLGGIKLKTAKQIEDNTQIYNNNIYKQYFTHEKELGDNELISILRDDSKGLIYASSLIYNIQKRWSEAGYSLDDKPGVIITLYNMGNPTNKKPHSNPDLGGSLIKIEGKQLYFGEIGYLLYHYLKYYID